MAVVARDDRTVVLVLSPAEADELSCLLELEVVNDTDPDPDQGYKGLLGLASELCEVGVRA